MGWYAKPNRELPAATILPPPWISTPNAGSKPELKSVATNRHDEPGRGSR
jgi:hypothetical protein